MAAPAYTEDLTDITLSESTSDGGTWVAIGGGNITLGAGPDLSMQGTNCVDCKISLVDKGPGVPVTSFSPGADDHIFAWLFLATPGLAGTLANRGLCAVVGVDVSNFVKFHVEGSDTYGARGRVGKCYVVRYVNTNNASPPNYRTVTGTPGTTPSFVGGTCNITGSVKGSNLGVDAIRYGTGGYLTAGELISAGDASDNPCTFTGFAAQDATSTNRWGILLDLGGGGFELQGRFVIGQNSSKVATAARFKAANQTIFFLDTPHALSDFSQVVLDHASTRCEWTNISLVGLGTTNPGRLVVNANNPTFVWTGGNNANIGPTTLRAGSTLSGISWRGCGQITQNGATIGSSEIVSSTASPALVADNYGSLSDIDFTSGGTGHALEITAAGTYTFNGLSFTGYAATNGSTGNEAVYVSAASGTVTINVSGGGTVPSVRTAGATVNVNASANVTLTGLVAGTELHAYLGTDPATVTEIAGIESSTTSWTFSQSSSGQQGYITIIKPGYKWIQLNLTYSGSDQSIPIQQQPDPGYSNP